MQTSCCVRFLTETLWDNGLCPEQTKVEIIVLEMNGILTCKLIVNKFFLNYVQSCYYLGWPLTYCGYF